MKIIVDRTGQLSSTFFFYFNELCHPRNFENSTSHLLYDSVLDIHYFLNDINPSIYIYITDL